MSAASRAEKASSGELLKILGLTFGVAVSIGEAIGSGILRSPSIIAAAVPGIGIIVGLWALGALQAFLQANILAEFATALPKTGGNYIYARRAYGGVRGDVAGLVVGWSNWLSKNAGTAAASVSFAEFLPLLWPDAGHHKIAVALAVQAALYSANIVGLREGRAVQEATSLVKAAMLFVFVVAAVVLVAPPEPSSLLPAAPTLHWAGIILAYQLIVGAYAGWNAPVYFCGENTAPEKIIPKALAYGIALTGGLYIAVNWALLHALGLQGVASSPLPFSIVLNHIGGTIPGILFALTAMITVASCANANIMSGPRVLYALGDDGLLPRSFARVNKGGSPTAAFLLTAVITLALAATGGFKLVFGLIATLNTVASIVTEAGFFVWRAREPEMRRPFRAWGYPLLPALSVLFNIILLFLFSWGDRVGMGVAIGMILLCIPFALIARRARKTAEKRHA
jgi:APA family basic amino acid/polyamine antiporter